MGQYIWRPREYEFGWTGGGQWQQEQAGHESYPWRLGKDCNVEVFESQVKEAERYLRIEEEARILYELFWKQCVGSLGEYKVEYRF